MVHTTYVTDFFEQLFDEEYERHEHDDDIESMHAFWRQFCIGDTEDEENPNWCHKLTIDWITEELEQQDGWKGIYSSLRIAIIQDIDEGYILKCVSDKHREWYDSKFPVVSSDESSDEEQTDPVATVPRAIFTCSNCEITFHDYNVRCTCPDDVNPPDPDGDGIAD